MMVHHMLSDWFPPWQVHSFWLFKASSKDSFPCESIAECLLNFIDKNHSSLRKSGTAPWADSVAEFIEHLQFS